MNFITTEPLFPHWKHYLEKNKNILFVDVDNLSKYADYRLLPLSFDNHISFQRFSNNVFPNDIENVRTLANKSRFAEFMLKNFNDHSPFILSYSYDNVQYISPRRNMNDKYIIKPNESYGGRGIRVVHHITEIPKNHVIQIMIKHSMQYVGHFLVLNGVIVKQIFFVSPHIMNVIRRGPIVDYEVRKTLPIDTLIFVQIFKHLQYSGFACSDGTIKDNKIIIFEIDPRPGGSLVSNSECLGDFIHCLHEHTL